MYEYPYYDAIFRNYVEMGLGRDAGLEMNKELWADIVRVIPGNISDVGRNIKHPHLSLTYTN